MIRWRGRWRGLPLAVSFALLLSACSTAPTPEPTPYPTSAPMPTAADAEQTVRAYLAAWRGHQYANKEVEAIAVEISGGWLVLTAIARYS